MVLVAGDAVHAFPGVLAVDPGLKDPSCLFLMAGQTLTDLLLGSDRNRKKKEDHD
jgi:hypothetical protein